jgi:FkbM family methyltransferase
MSEQKSWSLLEFFPDLEPIEILDVGAAIGETPSYQGLVDAGRACVTGFEPNAEECRRLNEAYGGTHRFYPHFVGDGQPAVFHETNWVLTGSLLEPNTPLLQKFQNLHEVTVPVARHAVATVRLDDLEDLPSIDFVKIDIQGGELAVFRNALRTLAGTVAIQTEVEFVEMYKRQPMFADVDIFLRDRGFQFHTFTGFGTRAFKPVVVGGNINLGLRQYLWSDAIYVRDWMKLDQFSPQKLAKYAVIANDILYSFDLAHLVLTALDRQTGGNLASRYLDRKCTPNG